MMTINVIFANLENDIVFEWYVNPKMKINRQKLSECYFKTLFFNEVMYFLISTLEFESFQVCSTEYAEEVVICALAAGKGI